LNRGQGPASNVISSIQSSVYTGGYTNIEAALNTCKEQLQGASQPVIVLITDGTPTACSRADGTIRTIYEGSCSNSSCSGCTNGPPLVAAETLADQAAADGISVVPVIVSSVSRDIAQLESLARCPSNSNSNCNVDDYKNLNVSDIDEIGELLASLVKVTGCE